MADEERKEENVADKTSGEERAHPPIIIKRINAGHHSHHGGAWKVAYADFVTAMMAFFLLMWLLSSVPSEQLNGIADYFESTIGIGSRSGIGFKGGLDAKTQGSHALEKDRGEKHANKRAGDIVSSPQRGKEISIEEMENETFEMIEGELKKIVRQDVEMRQFADSILFEQTPEGLKITVTAQDMYPLFKPGSAKLESYTKKILGKIAGLVRYAPNFISISGHTDKSAAYSYGNYTNWELSADRANSSRRYMVSQNIPAEQVAKVIARADSDPLDHNNPNSARNRRIEIVLLRNSQIPFHKVSAPKELISKPGSKGIEKHLSVLDD